MVYIIVRGSAYQNVLEPLNITHIMLIRIMMKNDYIDHDCNTVDLFKKLKIITFNKVAIVIIFMNENEF